jgi:TPR repeat protein
MGRVALAVLLVLVASVAFAEDKPRLEIPSRVPPQPSDAITPPPAPALTFSEELLGAKPTPTVGSPRILPCATRWLPLASESFACGRAAFDGGDYAEARRAFSDSARHARDHESRDTATYWEAEALWKLRRFDAAAWAFREVAASGHAKPLAKWTLYGLGWGALATGAFDDAVNAFTEAVRGRSDVPLGSAYLGLAFGHYGAKQWAAAIRAWDAAERLLAESLPRETLFWKAYAFAQLNNVEAATRELQRFIAGAHDRAQPSAHLHLGWSLLAAGRPAHAITPLRTAVSESSGSDKAWAIGALARALRSTGRTEELRALALTMLGGGTDVDGWLALSGAVMSVGHDDARAAQLFSLARKHAPRPDVARHATLELAKLHLKAERFRDALAEMASFTPGDETDRHLAALVRAEAAYALRDYATAETEYHGVLRAGVIKLERLPLAAAWATLHRGDAPAAGKQFLAFAMAAPRDAEAGGAIARAAHIAVEHEGAHALFKDVVALARVRPEAFAVLLEASANGHPHAQYHVARAYESGQVVGRDFAEAARWYRRAAELGHADAQFALATLFEVGLGLPRDDAEALKWYRRSAAQGIAAAQFELGLRHDLGRGFPKSSAEAVRWYRKAAEQGLAAAEHYLGLSYGVGEGVARDLAEAASWYRRAAVRGYAAAQYRLALAHRLGTGVRKDDAEALRWFRAAAENGHVGAQVLLGYVLMTGDGVMNDDRDAAAWFARAADAGDAAAQYFFGVMLETGRGTRANPALAAQWYRRAADAGNLDAQVALGFLHEEGRGVVKDPAAALEWYRKAARRGNVSAQVNLGTMYFRGHGVVQDYAEAIKWWRAAAEAGDGDAQLRLARCYQNGCGPMTDPVQAHRWFNLAATRLGGADQKSAAEGREAVAKFMTPAQVAEAQQLARAWTAPRERTITPLVKASGLEVGSAGTGFFVDRTGFIVAGAQILEGCVKVRARNTVHDAPQAARLVAVDKANDLALLRVASASPLGRSGGVPLQNVNIAMQTTRVRSFLEGQHVELEPAPAGRAAGTVDLAERARRLGVIVECVK